MSLEYMFEDEQDPPGLLLDESQREGEFEMSIQHINRLQEEADSAYNRVPQSEAAAWAQVIAQCEIALQLQGINEKLENFDLQDIAKKLESIDGRLEKVYVSADENFDLQDIAKKLESIAAILRDK